MNNKITIYCDGVFDLFHKGHLEHLKNIKNYFNQQTYLIVGVISDKLCTNYKRKPILNEIYRKKILSSCIYTDEVIIVNSLIVDNFFLINNNIDYVFHAFSDKNDKNKQYEFYEIPIKLQKFIEIEYYAGISTTKIIKDYLNWTDIFELKGNNPDLLNQNGYDDTLFDPYKCITQILYYLKLDDKNDKILDLGCGSGLLSCVLKDDGYDDYIGVDKSNSLCLNHINLLNRIALSFDSTDIIFKSKYFDFSICNSMLEYLLSIDDVEKTINELERITKKGIYVGSIRKKTHTNKKNKHKYNGIFTHLVLNESFFINKGYTIINCVYDNDNRFDAYKLFI